jgi:integrase
MSLKHIDIENRSVFQDAREVRTKNSKTFRSSWFPVGNDIEVIVVDWIAFLRTERLFGPEDPLFPATKVDLGADGLFAPIGLDRKHWKSADSIRRIFKQAFERAGLPYFSPHRFRDTLTLLGERICTTPEEFKAWSQNFSHESVMTTFRSYGTVSCNRQQEILAKLRNKTATNGAIDTTPDADTIKCVLDHLRNSTA